MGITPMLAMLDHLARTSCVRQVTVVHAARSPRDHPHREEQAELVARLAGAELQLWYETDAHLSAHTGARSGRPALGHLRPRPDSTAYLCGPLPFMRAVRGDLLALGVHPSAVHYEVFGPDLWRSR
ncbi:hypothetical protein JT723_18940 [Streptomyces bryophytorum]|uniref:Flavohemoprotein (Hemoglobin-like protein) (Flavohemoglobin) (Nitric oxide dioxygenase) n=1 Tax=Actinacidiphila bryophytorum TaxID=1436133 RepID=A0A9W4E948_9ACTN|nr:hypothetical protein [Actinacidiphila bryophytorum]MBM9437917.1 hypothetical protein [Actinacidiphila bryophytorum]MBN6547515.1 hypothetical protein [Actinacidiphila bryophytorum]CAG7623318.1 Flavohemoprotein (Hemoglobin-like protein) (Flavohemoglobin) (Nitric oxide dioxygenase) [Actinacidiphila bryophytorum]